MTTHNTTPTHADRLALLLAAAGMEEAGVENTGGWTMNAVVPCENGVVAATWDGRWFIAFHAGDAWWTQTNDGLPDWTADVATDGEAVQVIARAVDEHGGGMRTSGGAL